MLLVSGVQQSDLVTHIHVSILFQIVFPCRLSQSIEFPVLYSRSLLVIYFIHSSICVNPKLLIYPFPNYILNFQTFYLICFKNCHVIDSLLLLSHFCVSVVIRDCELIFDLS